MAETTFFTVDKLAVTPFPEVVATEEKKTTAFKTNSAKKDLVQLEIVFQSSPSQNNGFTFSKGGKVMVREDLRALAKDVMTVDGKEFVLIDRSQVVCFGY